MNDQNNSFKWIMKVAEQGDSEAQFLIARMYEKGEQIVQSYERAMEWYLLSAKQGYADAQYNLARMYEIKGKELR